MNEYKIVVLGSGGVGKSALTVQYVQGVFVESYDPTIEDSYRKKVDINGKQVVVEILDTAGTEQFTAMRSLYIRNGRGFVLVYSTTSHQTFTDLQPILDSIFTIKETNDIPIIIVGNKCDLEEERAVPTEVGRKFAAEKNCAFIEASAKTRINVAEIFKLLIEKLAGTNNDGKKKKKSGGCHLI